MTIHVLVVGSEELADQVQGLLGEPPAAYKVEAEETYEKALRTLVRNTYDVCLLDCHAPEMGVGLLKKANAGGCVTPTILITNLADNEIWRDVEDAGAAGFLSRSLDLSTRTVKHVIRYALSHFKQLQAIQDSISELQRQLADIGRKLRR